MLPLDVASSVSSIPDWRCPHGGLLTEACRLPKDHLGTHLPRRCRRCHKQRVANVRPGQPPHCLACCAAYDERLEQRSEVMGGAVVFRGSRLTLAAVAGRLRAGERWVEITEEYPYLLPDDVELLRAYRPAPSSG